MVAENGKLIDIMESEIKQSVQLVGTNKYFFLIMSVTSHVIVLFLFLIQFSITKKSISFGHPEAVFPAYFYQSSEFLIKSWSQIRPTMPLSNMNKQLKNELSLQKQESAAQIKSSNFSPKQNKTFTPLQPTSGNGKLVPELIALLHSSIQAHQQYPDNALDMQREGKTTVLFTLYPNGLIKNLKMIKSSGTPTLDQAALAAVKDAAPFQGVNKYLANPQEYQITVVFELT